MTGLPHFEHHAPDALADALALAARLGDRARVFAGGTELLPKMRAGRYAYEHLISINRIDELRRLEYSDGGGLVIGAAVRIRDVADHPAVRELYPALARACTEMATAQIRNMATVAGNLANGSPCADTAGPLLVADATVTLVASTGFRELPLADLFRGPGDVDIAPGEILTAIHVPTPAPRTGSAFRRISARSRVDIAAASASARLTLENGTIVAARIALGSVAPTPLRCPDAEAELVGHAPDDALLARAAAAAGRAARPIDDVRATAGYRRAVVPVLVRRALDECVSRIKGGAR